MYNSFEVVNNVESSHFPVFLELKINVSFLNSPDSLRTGTSIKYKIDSQNCDDYFHTLSNKIEDGCFDEFETGLQNPDLDINSILSLFEDAILKCSETYKKTRKNGYKKAKKDWFDEQCKNIKQIVKANQKAFRANRSTDNLNKYLQNKHEYKYLCRDKKRTYYQNISNKLENSINNSKNFWYELKRITDNTSVKNDISLTTWHDHFKSLFTALTDADETNNSETHYADMDFSSTDDFNTEIFNSYITDKEIIDAVGHLDVKKSASGNLSPSQIKFGITALLPFIRKLFNHVFNKGSFPLAWAQFSIVPLHKKGNINEPNNYRGIALLDVLSKLYI